jgi:hypothetical protein
MADSPAQPAKIKVAVVPTLAVNLDIARVDALCQDLAEALMVDLDVDAIGGIDVRRELPPDGVPSDCIAQPECVADTAKRLGADQLLFVAMVDVGNTGAIQIDTAWVDAHTNKRAERPAIALASVDAKARFVANAERLLPDAPRRKKDIAAPGITGTMSPAVGRHITTPFVVASGGFVVGAGLAVGFGLTARSRYDACKETLCTDSRVHSIKTLSLVADLANVTWVVSAGLATYFYFTSSREPHFMITPTAEGAAATYTGRF